MSGIELTPEQREAIARYDEKHAEQNGEAWLDWLAMRQPPRKPWVLINAAKDGGSYRHETLPIAVIMSAAVEADGKRWVHVSASRKGRMPNWADLKLVKRDFIGIDRKAIQVFPKASEYVNINPDVLHLWTCLDDDAIPDFTNGTGSI